MINVLTIGVSFALLKYSRNLAEKAVKATFAEKGKIADMNVLALNMAYDYVSKTSKTASSIGSRKLTPTRSGCFSRETRRSPWAKCSEAAECKRTIPSRPRLTKANTWKPIR
jgi:hypothetical protein